MFRFDSEIGILINYVLCNVRGTYLLCVAVKIVM